MLKIVYHSQFKRDYKLARKRGCNITELMKIIQLLQQKKPLPKKNRDHDLSGNYIGVRECHITPDWLLIYSINDQELTLELLRTGSHSDLF